MSKTVTIRINGKEYMMPEGVNLIDAAESVGVHIPNFCYIKGMKGIGACRMCMVEVGGRMGVACIMKTRDGMDVVTESEKINEIRKFVVDMILSMHPLDCMTCTKAGVCNLQNYAYDFEVRDSSYTRKKFGFPIDDKNPFIKRDPDYCILCGRCVRVCKEQGTSVLDFYGRGVGSKVGTVEDRPLQDAGCTFCGSCIDACPVNAILEADRWRKGREWDYIRRDSVCLFCGNACDTSVSVLGKDVAKINIGGADKGRADHYICAYGRYGFDYINAETRIVEPLKRIDGELKAVTWEEALQSVADVLRNPGDTGIVTTGNLLNEDILIIRGFADIAGIKSVDSTVSLYGDEGSLIGGSADIEDADLIMLVGVNPSQWERVLPALDATIRKRVARGAKLVVINSGNAKISDVALVTIGGDEAQALAGIAKALRDKGLNPHRGVDIPDVPVSEGAAKAAELISEAGSPLIVSSPSLYEVSRNIAFIKGGAISMPVEANAKGTVMMGLKAEGLNYNEMISGGVKVLYAVGEVPVKRPRGVEVLIVQHSHLTDLAREADIVLPSTTSHESEGTIIDYMGRLRTLTMAVEPYGEALSHRKIIRDIAKAMELDLKVSKTTDVKRVMKGFSVDETPASFKKRDDLSFLPEELIPALNAAMMNGSRIFWLKEIGRAVTAIE